MRSSASPVAKMKPQKIIPMTKDGVIKFASDRGASENLIQVRWAVRETIRQERMRREHQEQEQRQEQIKKETEAMENVPSELSSMSDQEEAFKELGLSQEDFEKTSIPDEGVLEQIKTSLRRQAQVFMTNVLKIALHMHQEKLSCIIVSYYEIFLDTALLNKAVKLGFFEFLKYLFGFGKNFMGDRYQDDCDLVSFTDLLYKVKSFFSELKD